MRAFVCRQFKKQDVIWASEIQSVRDFGSESALQQVQTEVARRLGNLRRDAEGTFEYHLLNGIQGLVKDPKDGATVVNYFTEFAITPATEVDFGLAGETAEAGIGQFHLGGQTAKPARARLTDAFQLGADLTAAFRDQSDSDTPFGHGSGFLDIRGCLSYVICIDQGDV